jgi:lysophospholipase L1-like esterase
MTRAAARIAVAFLTALALLAGCGDGDEQRQPAASSAEQTTSSEETAAPEPPSAEWDLVALGDSLPTDEGDAGPEQTFPEVLAKRISKDTGKTVNVTNLAVPGWASGDLRAAIDLNDEYREAIAGAEIVTLSIGGNDLFAADEQWLGGSCGGADDRGCYEKALAEFEKNLQAILVRILELRTPGEAMLRVTNVYDPLIGDKVAQAELGARYEDLSDLTAANLKEMNSVICGTARRVGMLCADLHTAFNGSSGHENPHAKGLISEDRVHPSVKGHQAIAATVAGLGYFPFS